MDSHAMEVPPDALALGRRVYLRLPAPDDRDAFTALVRASREHLARWVLDTIVQNDPDGQRWFDTMLQVNETGRSQKLLVQRLADGALLGCLSLNEIIRGAFQSAFLGYWIGAAFERQGYMSDALDAVLRYAFAGEGLHRLEANIQPENEASIALVRKLGFRREGLSPRYLRVCGDWRDHERWAITVEDWEARER